MNTPNNMFKQSNLLRAYKFGKVKMLDFSISFSDMAYLIRFCRDKNLKAILQETIDEASKELSYKI